MFSAFHASEAAVCSSRGAERSPAAFGEADVHSSGDGPDKQLAPTLTPARVEKDTVDTFEGNGEAA